MIPDIKNATNDTAAALAAGEELAKKVEVRDYHGHLLTFVPAGLNVVDHTLYRPAPPSLEEDVNLQRPEDFCAYVALFADAVATLVFADYENDQFGAILDYHKSATEPSWGRHKATLKLAHTAAWQIWAGKNKAQMTQTEFGQFLEDNLPDIAAPNGADLLEVARSFEANKSVNFKSSRRESDGSVNFAYEEDVKGTTKQGGMKVPTEFVLGLVPYEGSKKYAVTARLRYRLGTGGALSLWYELQRIEDVLDAAFTEIEASIREKLTPVIRAMVRGNTE